MDHTDLPKLEDHVEHLLDQALEATFPASDPVAVSSPAAMGAVPSAPSAGGRIKSG